MSEQTAKPTLQELADFLSDAQLFDMGVFMDDWKLRCVNPYGIKDRLSLTSLAGTETITGVFETLDDGYLLENENDRLVRITFSPDPYANNNPATVSLDDVRAHILAILTRGASKEQIDLITQKIHTGEITHISQLAAEVSALALPNMLKRLHWEYDERSEQFTPGFISDFKRSPMLMKLIQTPDVVVLAGTFITDKDLLESFNGNDPNYQAAFALSLGNMGPSGWRGDVLMLDSEFKAIGTAVWVN